MTNQQPHTYLSTACLHHDHTYCQTDAHRYDGTRKTAATCKFCGTPCICPCHPLSPDETHNHTAN